MSERAKFSVTKKDFEITWFSGTGGGGQHRNKHANCCRLKHKDTGIIKIGQSFKSRQQNQKKALQSMADDPIFKAFCERKLREIENGKPIEKDVDEIMSPDNIRVEYKDESGNWQVEK